MKIIATIEARLDSSRFPKKLIQKINGKPAIYYLIKRLQKIREIEKVVLCTTKRKVDDNLVKLANKYKIHYFRGSYTNVIKRILQASKKFKAQIIVQASGDSLFSDPELIRQKLFMLRANKADIVCAFPQTLPEGIDTPVIKVSSLKRSYKLIKRKNDYEHVTKSIFDNKNKFIVIYYTPKFSEYFPNLDLCLDEINDLKLIKKFISHEKKNKKMMNTGEIVSFIKKNKKIININKNVKRKNNPKGFKFFNEKN